jgi:heme exporter protein A
VALQIEASGLKKVFNRRVIFQNIAFTLKVGDTLLVTGRNGSGKSTLMKIISNVLTPTAGTVSVLVDNAAADPQTRQQLTGFVSPYLQMYDEFSAREMLKFAVAIRGMRADSAVMLGLLRRVALEHRSDDPLRTYSSGMKQRMKYAFALVHQPSLLLLDEPMANLDADGESIVRDIMEEHRTRGILVVATNNLDDVRSYDHQIDLNVSR